MLKLTLLSTELSPNQLTVIGDGHELLQRLSSLQQNSQSQSRMTSDWDRAHLQELTDTTNGKHGKRVVLYGSGFRGHIIHH
jgi:hypothetical protein